MKFNLEQAAEYFSTEAEHQSVQLQEVLDELGIDMPIGNLRQDLDREMRSAMKAKMKSQEYSIRLGVVHIAIALKRQMETALTVQSVIPTRYAKPESVAVFAETTARKIAEYTVPERLPNTPQIVQALAKRIAERLILQAEG